MPFFPGRIGKGGVCRMNNGSINTVINAAATILDIMMLLEMSHNSKMRRSVSPSKGPLTGRVANIVQNLLCKAIDFDKKCTMAAGNQSLMPVLNFHTT